MTKVSVFVSEKRPTKRSMHSDADFMLPGNRFVAIALPDSCTRTIKAFVSALLSQSVLSRRRDSTRYSGEARRGGTQAGPHGAARCHWQAQTHSPTLSQL